MQFDQLNAYWSSEIWCDVLLSRTASRCRRAYFHCCGFFLSFLFFDALYLRSLNGQPNLDTYSLMTAICKVRSELSWAFTTHGLDGKMPFLGLTLNFDRTYLCNWTWYQQSERNLSICRDSPSCTQIWWTLVQKRTMNGWRVCAHPYTFALGDTASLTAWTLYSRQQTNFGKCYVVARAYSLEQQLPGGLTLDFAFIDA